MVAFLPRSEFEALQTKYLETHAEKENLELQYNLKAEFEDPEFDGFGLFILIRLKAASICTF